MELNFDEETTREGTNSVQYDGLESIFNQKDLLPFWIADMDFKIPNPIAESMHKRIDNGIFGYTLWQTDSFYNPIKYWWKRRHNVELENEDIQYAASVLFAVRTVIRENASIGDSVLINSPSYNNFISLLARNNRRLVDCPLTYSNGKYTMDFEMFEDKIKSEDIKVFLHCNPHNPTGKIWTEEETYRILEICEKHNVYVISDEIHKDFVRDKEDFVSVARFMDEFKNTIVVSGTGKAFNLASVSVAYTITKDRKMNEKIMDAMERMFVSSPPSLGLVALETAYNECEEWMDGVNQYIDKNLDYVESYINTHLSEELTFKKPKATFLAWIDFGPSGFTEEEVQHAFKEVGGIAISPGSMYLDKEKSHFRFNVGFRHEQIVEAMTLIKQSFDYLNKNMEITVQ